MTVTELANAMELARKRLGITPIVAKVMRVENRHDTEDTTGWDPTASAYPNRVTVEWSDGHTQVMYFMHTDLALGVGMSMAPHSSILSDDDRVRLVRSGAFGAAETVMTGQQVEGKRVLVIGFGPTGGWAAYEAKKANAAQVDWVGSVSAPGGNQGAFDRTKGIDRVQEAIAPDAGINISMHRVLAIKAEGEGAIVTYVGGPETDLYTYQVKYDLVLSAMKPDNSGPATAPPSDGMPPMIQVLDGAKMRPHDRTRRWKSSGSVGVEGTRGTRWRDSRPRRGCSRGSGIVSGTKGRVC